ncbi:MAG: RagB/SusD family nutrient uptake outer membrane protein [Prevotella sp.]|nr:RagB/SusD family nutrient uptake outer membrane protein [Prevotella sp.]
MKKIYLYIAALAITMGISSCEDMLDTESLSTDNLEYLTSNSTDARKMIDHVYSYFCEDTYTSRMSTNWMQNTDIEVGFLTKANTEEATRRGIWSLNAHQFSDIKNAWDNALKAIDFSNQIIVGIEGSDAYKNGDRDMKQLLGETYCLRAYWYWLMCNFWADVPFATTPTTNNDMHNDPRTDKNIIYTHMIQDLIDHEAEMKWSSEVTVERMNRDFALGFIVKLAMFRAGYSMQADGSMSRCNGTGEEYTVHYVDENGNAATASSADDYYKVAKAYALKLINLKPHTLLAKYKEIFDNEINGCNPADGDVLFEMGFVPNSGGDIGWCHGLSVVASTKGAGTTYTNLMPSYACSFDPDDQRLPVTCVNYRYLYDDKQAATDALGIQPAKWCRLDLNVTSVASKGTGINWPVLRYADVLLLLAEADNEINGGPTDLARQMLKVVRDRAFANSKQKSEKVDNYIAGLSDYKSFKEAIINERAWEFGGENIRKFDLVRWNNYSEKVVDAIEWIRDVAMNYSQTSIVNGEFLYDKNQEIVPMDVANRLYYNYKKGQVVFENDYFTYRDRTESPYNTAERLADDDIKAAGATYSGLKYVNFMEALMSVSDTNPETKEKYGTTTDENGKEVTIKKGILNERIRYSWIGLTGGLLETGVEDLTPIRSKVTPYVLPIPSDRIMSSGGVLSNNGYGILNP